MEYPQFYEADLMRFFENHPEEQAVYETLAARMAERFPDASVRVQKSQISFYNRHLFAAASLPLRRKKSWPARCLMVTFGWGTKCPSRRIAVATEPYPGRWTHHVLLERSADVDEELLSWLQAAYDFSMHKR